MERVAALLQQYDLGGALVRLWVLASNKQRLGEWELTRNVQTFNGDVDDFIAKIEEARHLVVPDMEIKAIALIHAVDTVLASTRTRNRLLSDFDEDGNKYALARQDLDWRAKTALKGQPGGVLAYFQHHVIIPMQLPEGIEVKLYQCDPIATNELTRLREEKNATLKIWIGHFSDDADVQWDKTSSAAGNWRTTEVTPSASRIASLLVQMDAAKAAGANMVVLPEFSLDIAQRKALQQWLKSNASTQLLYVVAGSFHESGDSGKFYNTAPLLATDGTVVFTHEKLRTFGKGGIAEDVSIGKTLHVLVTPLGCLTVLICKDFMDKDTYVANLLQHVLVDWVLVPSFGDESTIRGHQGRALDLAKVVSGVNSAVANSRNTAMSLTGSALPALPGFGHRSQANAPCAVPATGGIVAFPLAQAVKRDNTRPTLMRIK